MKASLGTAELWITQANGNTLKIAGSIVRLPTDTKPTIAFRADGMVQAGPWYDVEGVVVQSEVPVAKLIVQKKPQLPLSIITVPVPLPTIYTKFFDCTALDAETENS